MRRPRQPPTPGEWHPWYEAKRRALQRWLDGEGTYRDRVQIPVMPVFRLSDPDPDPVTTVDMPGVVTLVKTKCAGPAPYVGRPFCYMWTAAYDDYGRCIAGEAMPEYTMSEMEWAIRCGDFRA